MTDTHLSPDALIADGLTPADIPSDPSDGEWDHWQIDGRHTAEWAIAKVRAAHESYADATAPARDAIEVLEARIAELREFIDGEGRQRDHTVKFFEAHLIGWVRRRRQADLDDGLDPDKATKSIKLAGGTVGSRAGQDRVDVANAHLLVEWVSAEEINDPAVVTIVDLVPKVDQRRLKAYIRDTGQVPSGVTYQPATEEDRSWSVKLS